MGLVISIFGGYVYQKNQNEEKFKESSLNRITVVGASYIMSFGGVLIIIAIDDHLLPR